MRITASKAPVVAAVLAAATTAAAQSRTAEKPGAIEQRAIEALDKMGAFLREQQSFTVHTTTQTDYVLESGMKVRLSSHGELRVRRPDHLRADVTSDRKARQFFYDGKQFIINGQRLGYYACLAAPPTIGELANVLQDRYGLELPLVDMFRWGTAASSVGDITAAIYVGPAMIDGVQTDQYAFRQPGVDWQIWIDQGARPLPRKIVLTTTDDPARPEHEIALSWQLGTRHDDQEFRFVPDKDSKRINIAELAPTGGQEARRARRAPKKRESS